VERLADVDPVAAAERRGRQVQGGRVERLVAGVRIDPEHRQVQPGVFGDDARQKARFRRVAAVGDGDDEAVLDELVGKRVAALLRAAALLLQLAPHLGRVDDVGVGQHQAVGRDDRAAADAERGAAAVPVVQEDADLDRGRDDLLADGRVELGGEEWPDPPESAIATAATIAAIRRTFRFPRFLVAIRLACYRRSRCRNNGGRDIGHSAAPCRLAVMAVHRLLPRCANGCGAIRVSCAVDAPRNRWTFLKAVILRIQGIFRRGNVLTFGSRGSRKENFRFVR
jgi:hypothetical protein